MIKFRSVRLFGTLVLLYFVAFFATPFPVLAQTVIATVSGVNGPFGLSVNPYTNLIYVSNSRANSVAVINGVANEVVNTIPIGTNPEGIAIGPSNNFVYVATGFNFVKVIDSTTNSVVGTITVQTASNSVAVNPITNRIYVTNRGCCPGNSVSVIDGSNNSVITSIPVGGSPRGIAVNTNTNRIYVANIGNHTVSVINGNSNSVISTIPFTGAPFGVAVNPNTNLIYVSSHVTNTVEVIDGVSNSIIKSIPVPMNSQFTLDVNPSTNRVYVAGSTALGDKLAIIDANINQIVSTVPVGQSASGGGAQSVGVNPFTNRIYVANFQGDTVSVIQDLVNEPPTVDAGGPYEVSEGGSAQLAATGSDPENGPLTYAWDLDNNGSFETPGQNVTFSAASLAPGEYTIAVQVTDDGNLTATDQTTVTVVRRLTVLAPAQVWIGLKNSDDVGTRFDLLAEVYKDGNLITSGQLNNVWGGSSGFNNARLNTINFNSFSPVDFPQGSALSIKLYVRNACQGPTHNSGRARLWFNDGAANSLFGATIGTTTNNYFLLNNFLLGTSAGAGPKKTIDVQAGSPCSPFKPFGTWAITP